MNDPRLYNVISDAIRSLEMIDLDLVDEVADAVTKAVEKYQDDGFDPIGDALRLIL